MSSNNGEISHEQSTKVVNIIEDTKEKLQSKPKEQFEAEKQITTENPQNTQDLSKVENQNLDKLDHIIRKNAHGFLYMVLAILISASIFSYDKSGKDALVYVLFICQFYAVTDEFHQAFVPGRTSLVSDVLVDFVGTLIGVVIFYFVYYKIYKRIKLRKKCRIL